MEEAIAIKERNAIAEFEITPARVADMAKRYLELTVPEGNAHAYKVARAALTTCVHARTGTDKRRKELGEDARTWIAECGQAAKDLIAPLEPVEAHLRAELKREDDRKEAIRAEKERIEQERLDEIRKGIFALSKMVASLNGLDSATLMSLGEEIEAIEITPDEYQELTKEANQAKHDAYIAVREAYEARIEWENGETARREERARLEKVAAEQDAEAERLRKIDEKQKAERQSIEDEKAALEAKLKAIQDKEDARIQAEKDAKEKAEQEEKDRIEREEAEEAEEAEKLRQIALRPDKQKLIDFANELYNMPMPMCDDTNAQQVVNQTQSSLRGVADDLKSKAEEL